MLFILFHIIIQKSDYIDKNSEKCMNIKEDFSE